MSDEKLQAMCVLLTEQHKALQEDIYSQRMEMAHEFGYAAHRKFREEELCALIREAQQELQAEAAFMRRDVAAVQDDKVFKTMSVQDCKRGRS